jgi:hypothetical protein
MTFTSKRLHPTHTTYHDVLFYSLLFHQNPNRVWHVASSVVDVQDDYKKLFQKLKEEKNFEKYFCKKSGIPLKGGGGSANHTPP